MRGRRLLADRRAPGLQHDDLHAALPRPLGDAHDAARIFRPSMYSATTRTSSCSTTQLERVQRVETGLVAHGLTM